MLIQPATLADALGSGLWFIAWCVILCYIFGWNKNPQITQETSPLTRVKLINNATKVVVAIFSLLPLPMFAQIFELWVKTQGNVEQSLDLLKTVSNIIVTLAIGGLTAYIAYQKYQIDRNLAELELRKQMDEYRKRKGIPSFLY